MESNLDFVAVIYAYSVIVVALGSGYEFVADWLDNRRNNL